MNLLKLRLSMLGTVAVIIAVSTLGFSLLLALVGQFNITTLVIMVALFNVAQWLLAPYLVNSLYRVRPMAEGEHSHLHSAVERLSERSGIRTPKLMYSEIPIPNAFAYGSPLTGSHVAVTKGLLSELDPEETEAVIGHELGHLKHRDVQVMMFISFLPSLFYMLARSFMFSSYYGGRDRRDTGGLALVGGLSMLIYFFLLLFNLSLSRMREYYADQHSASIVEDGARKLSEGLAKISTSTWRVQSSQRTNMGLSSFKTLFIADPDSARRDSAQLSRMGGDDDLVRSIAGRRLTFFDKFSEIFSTHPNIVKRLRALNA
jgi:heat shock protein HtpX